MGGNPHVLGEGEVAHTSIDKQAVGLQLKGFLDCHSILFITFSLLLKLT